MSAVLEMEPKINDIYIHLALEKEIKNFKETCRDTAFYPSFMTV